MILKSAGNLGLGVTPSTIDLGKNFEIGVAGSGLWSTGSATDIRMMSNVYYNGGYKFGGTGYGAIYQVNAGVFSWYQSSASGTAGAALTQVLAMSLDTAQNLTLQKNISVGGATVTTSGTGITFPATQSASSNANTLDDYEEGTWTPAQGSGLTVVGAYSSSGQYTKIGRSVTVFGEVVGATSVACSANGQICTGLPFTPNTEFQGALINGTRSFSNNVGALASGAVQNSTVIAATSKLSFTITYFV
jgi:hypothetical protein